MKFCPICGKTFPTGKFCKDCGTMLVDAQPASEVQNPIPEVQDPTLEVQNPAPEVQNPAPEVQNPAPEVQNPAPEVQNPAPVDYSQNYPVNPPAPVQKKSGNSSKIIIAIIAVLLIAAIAVATFFIVKKMNKNDIDTDNNNIHNDISTENNNVYNDISTDNNNILYYKPSEQSQTTDEETTIISEVTSTPLPITTEPVIEENAADAYEAFDDFYISYLNAINALDSSLMTNCSPEVRSEMAERFDINKKSLFELQRIEFDEDSLYINPRGDYTEYTVYVNCVTMLYDRSTNEQKELNYSCWEVTIEYKNNTYTVTKMERDSDYKMSNNVTTISSNNDLFQLSPYTARIS